MFLMAQVIRVLRGQGDQWDSRARARGVTASFSLNGIGLVPEETTDLYQENEELKVIMLSVIAIHRYPYIYTVLTRVTVSSGGDPEVGGAHRVHEDRAHGDAQQAHQAKDGWLLQHARSRPRASDGRSEPNSEEFHGQLYPQSMYLSRSINNTLIRVSLFCACKPARRASWGINWNNLLSRRLWSEVQRQPQPRPSRTRLSRPGVCTEHAG